MRIRSALLLAATLFAASAPAAAPTAKPAELIALLQSDVPKAEKAKTFKLLAVSGNKDAVPAIAKYLSDEELSSWARIALEAIPDPACDDALRKALPGLKGRLLIGAINSIGVRRDAQAVTALAALLNDADVEVARAAAASLGRIGDDAAAKSLTPALTAAGPVVRSEVADALVRCAETALAVGQRDEAIRLYDLVSKADVPQHRVLEGVRGAIVARGSAGLPLLAEQLKSPDKKRFALGLKLTRELSAPEVTDILLAELGQAAAARQSLLLMALADRADPRARDALVRAAQNGSVELRIASLRGLKKVGDRSCGPVLIAAAMEEDARVSEPAVEVLADLPGKEIDELVLAQLQSGAGKNRLALIDLAGRRHIEAAASILLKLADDPDPSIRSAALSALGATISVQDLPFLIVRIADDNQPEEAQAAVVALHAACRRTSHGEAATVKVLEAIASAKSPAKSVLLGVLVTLGSEQGLKAVADAAQDAQPEIRRAGYRALGEWPTADAGPALLDLVKTGDPSLKIGALRGYIRIARQFNIPDGPRMAMFREIMTLAQRDDERRLALDILKQVRTAESLSTAAKYLDQPPLCDAAATVAITISEKLLASEPNEVTAAMTQVVQSAANKDLVEKARSLLSRTGKN